MRFREGAAAAQAHSAVSACFAFGLLAVASCGADTPSSGGESLAGASGVAVGGTAPNEAGLGGASASTVGRSSGSGGGTSTGGLGSNSAGMSVASGGNMTSSGGSSTAGAAPGTAGMGSNSGGMPTGGGGMAGAASSLAGAPGLPPIGARQFHTAGWAPVAGDIWVASNGDDSAPGTETAPLKTVSAALGKATGKTVWVKAGNYSLSGEELSGADARISGVTSGAMPVFNLPKALMVDGDNNHIRYIEFTSSGDNGCIRSRGTGNTFEWLKMHDCGNTAMQLHKGAANCRVINVDSYLNYDVPKKGENADGFAAKFSLGQGNVFLGCRAYNNSDDGWDFWQAGNDSPVTMQYCWAFDMRHPIGGSAADGNGFKLGTPSSRGSDGNAAHQLSDCFAFHNPSTGFHANGNTSGKINCTNCGAWKNKSNYGTGGGGKDINHSGDVTLSVTAEQAKAAKRDANGNLPDIEKL